MMIPWHDFAILYRLRLGQTASTQACSGMLYRCIGSAAALWQCHCTALLCVLDFHSNMSTVTSWRGTLRELERPWFL
jgi:hypothetical protein